MIPSTLSGWAALGYTIVFGAGGVTVIGIVKYALAKQAVTFWPNAEGHRMYVTLRSLNWFQQRVLFCRSAVDDFRVTYVIRPCDGRPINPRTLEVTFYDQDDHAQLGRVVRLSSSRSVFFNIPTITEVGSYEIRVIARWHGHRDVVFSRMVTVTVDGVLWLDRSEIDPD